MRGGKGRSKKITNPPPEGWGRGGPRKIKQNLMQVGEGGYKPPRMVNHNSATANNGLPRVTKSGEIRLRGREKKLGCNREKGEVELVCTLGGVRRCWCGVAQGKSLLPSTRLRPKKRGGELNCSSHVRTKRKNR